MSQTQACCQLCSFRGCDGDWCRHGASRVDSGYYRCNGTGSLFEPQLLTLLLQDQPLYHGLLFAPGVYEPGVSQVESRLDHQLSVNYGQSVSAHFELADFASFPLRSDSELVGVVPDWLDADHIPRSVRLAITALVTKAGFACGGPPDTRHLVRTIHVHRRCKQTRQGCSVGFTYYVDIGGIRVQPVYEG
jgi:hypothetical protein